MFDLKKYRTVAYILVLVLIICIFRYNSPDRPRLRSEKSPREMIFQPSTESFPISVIASRVKNNPPISDIFVRTWIGDGHWIIFMLRSIKKFVDPSAYRQIIITYNEKDETFFKSYLPYFDLPIKLVPLRDDPGWTRGLNNGGYRAQMYAKMNAFRFSDADYFVHVDSDCIFKKPVNRSHFMDDQGRVYVKKLLFSSMPSPKFLIWKEPAEFMLKFPVPYETMTRFPITFPRDLYIKTLHRISNVHNTSVLKLMQSLETCNEFTTLGGYLISLMPSHWVDLPETLEISDVMVQSWSWGGFKPEIVSYYECILNAPHYSNCSLYHIPV